MVNRRRNGAVTETTPVKTATFYYWDHLGTVRMTAGENPTAANVELHDYEPYGLEMLPATNQAGNTHQFTGHERDALNGVPSAALDYMHARFYGSNMGRFLNADPGMDIDPADPQRWNLYTYVRNNPLSNIDPTGKGTKGASIAQRLIDEKKLDPFVEDYISRDPNNPADYAVVGRGGKGQPILNVNDKMEYLEEGSQIFILTHERNHLRDFASKIDQSILDDLGGDMEATKAVLEIRAIPPAITEAGADAETKVMQEAKGQLERAIAELAKYIANPNRGFKDGKSGGILKSIVADGMSKESAKKKILEKWELKTP